MPEYTPRPNERVYGKFLLSAHQDNRGEWVAGWTKLVLEEYPGGVMFKGFPTCEAALDAAQARIQETEEALRQYHESRRRKRRQ